MLHRTETDTTRVILKCGKRPEEASLERWKNLNNKSKGASTAPPPTLLPTLEVLFSLVTKLLQIEAPKTGN